MRASVENDRKVWVVLLSWATSVTIRRKWFNEIVFFLLFLIHPNHLEIRDLSMFEFCFCHLLAEYLWGKLSNFSQVFCWIRTSLTIITKHIMRLSKVRTFLYPNQSSDEYNLYGSFPCWWFCFAFDYFTYLEFCGLKYHQLIIDGNTNFSWCAY